MCDRIDAIRYIITNRFGSKEELKSQIHEHYNTFVVTGFIYEPPEAPDFEDDLDSAKDPVLVQEWIATPEAYRRAKLLKIKTRKDFKLPSTPDERLKTRSSVLETVLKIMGR